MNKKLATAFFLIVGFIILLSIFFVRKNKDEPVTFTSSGSYRLLTIDDLINEAELIVIGEVKTTLPSRWMSPNGKELKNATPQEIFEAEGLFTDSLFSIDQILKGNSEEPVIRIRSFVGETNQVHWVDDTQPSYKQNQIFLLFLKNDNGPSANIAPGYYKSVNAIQGVYEIVVGKAISVKDEWVLDELIAYIQKSLSTESPSPALSPVPTELLIETLTPSPTPIELPTQTPLPTETTTPTP